MYESFTLHASIFIFVLCVSVWNGGMLCSNSVDAVVVNDVVGSAIYVAANYYFDIFSRKYEAQSTEKQEKARQRLGLLRQNNPREMLKVSLDGLSPRKHFHPSF